MKKQYLYPESETIYVNIEERFLDASLGSGSTGENISGEKNKYDWDWDN